MDHELQSSGRKMNGYSPQRGDNTPGVMNFETRGFALGRTACTYWLAINTVGMTTLTRAEFGMSLNVLGMFPKHMYH